MVTRSPPLRVMEVQQLGIKDNTPEKKVLFSDIQSLTSKIANKTLGQLEREGVFVFPEMVRDAKDISRAQMILWSDHDTYKTGNVMGFIGYKNERLIIGSRFDNDKKDFFFQYLLHQVLDLPNIVDLKTDANQDDQLFNFLLFLFPYYLKTAMRKGLFKQYIRRDYNDLNIKGTIDIARHIRLNTPFTGKIAYSQREFSYDNPLMQLVRHTIEFIKQKSYGNTLLGRVKDEVKQVVGATPRYELHDRQKIIFQNEHNPVKHAYFREYLSLQRLCLLILRHEKHLIGSGSSQIYGLLFDGAWLWEEYINNLIGDLFYHPRNKGGKGSNGPQWLFTNDAEGKGGLLGLIYPDFIGKDPCHRTIADAKYKPIDNIGNRDYLQVLAYMFRFDAKAGYYLYPEKELENADLRLRVNEGVSSPFENTLQPRNDISVTKHGLRIPQQSQSYGEFVDQMKQSEEAFAAIFRNGPSTATNQAEEAGPHGQ